MGYVAIRPLTFALIGAFRTLLSAVVCAVFRSRATGWGERSVFEQFVNLTNDRGIPVRTLNATTGQSNLARKRKY